MAEITLSDYMGFIFSEITRARYHADEVSKKIALEYAKDDILKSFSVPRFKIPEMELSIPVVISGAKFTTVLLFNMPSNLFNRLIENKIKMVMKTIYIKTESSAKDFAVLGNDVFNKAVASNLVTKSLSTQKKQSAATNITVSTGKATADSFYQELKDSTDPGYPENIVVINWNDIFYSTLQDNNLLESYKNLYPNNELFIQTLGEVLKVIKSNTIVFSAQIDNLLVNPETNAVKNEGSDISVFSIKAKIMEEGIFIRSIKDEKGNNTQVVEFD